jgi:hypothetical protein
MCGGSETTATFQETTTTTLLETTTTTLLETTTTTTTTVPDFIDNDGAYKGTTPYINGIRIVKSDTFDSFIIDLDITQDSDLIPNSPYIARCDRETCTIDPEMGPFIPDYVEEWLYVSFPGYSIVRNSDGGWFLDNERTASTFSGQRIVESDGPILYGRAYGEFEANLELSVGIVPGSIFRSYETANPQTIVIEVDK